MRKIKSSQSFYSDILRGSCFIDVVYFFRRLLYYFLRRNGIFGGVNLYLFYSYLARQDFFSAGKMVYKRGINEV